VRPSEPRFRKISHRSGPTIAVSNKEHHTHFGVLQVNGVGSEKVSSAANRVMHVVFLVCCALQHRQEPTITRSANDYRTTQSHSAGCQRARTEQRAANAEQAQASA
jgi:hypothetical protein